MNWRLYASRQALQEKSIGTMI